MSIVENPEAVCIIVGGGHAAANLAPTVRAKGWQGKVIVISEEGMAPYHRPPLSKEYFSKCLDSEMEAEGVDDADQQVDEAKNGLYIRKPDFYNKKNIELRLNKTVSNINRETKTVTLISGEKLIYDKLALATGARPRKLDLPGADLRGVFYMRNISDADAVVKAVAESKKIKGGCKAVIIGGGYIGLEAASSLTKVGAEVTILEAAERILQRVTGPVMSDFYRRVHTEEGVTIKEGISGLEKFVGNGKGNGQVERIVLSDGTQFDADIVLVGIGVIPNTELADECGLEVTNGIRVDEFAQTSDANIVAAGDCVNFYDRFYDMDLRLESVPHANGQAATAALSICGKPKAYEFFPWFWSDQYDINLQIAGLSIGYDDIVIRGDLQNSRKGAAFYFKDEQLIAVDAINNPKEFMLARKFIPQKPIIDKTKLLDVSLELADVFANN